MSHDVTIEATTATIVLEVPMHRAVCSCGEWKSARYVHRDLAERAGARHAAFLAGVAVEAVQA